RSCRIMVMAMSGLSKIHRTIRQRIPNFDSQPPWSISWKSINPLFATNRSSIARRYSTSLIGFCASSTISRMLTRIISADVADVIEAWEGPQVGRFLPVAFEKNAIVQKLVGADRYRGSIHDRDFPQPTVYR